MLACLSTNPIEASCSSCAVNLSSGGLFCPCPAIDTTICCMSCANAFCCSCDVGAAAAGTEPEPETDEVVVGVVAEAAGVEVVEVVAAVVDVVVVDDAADEVDEAVVGLNMRPGPTCGMPIVLEVLSFMLAEFLWQLQPANNDNAADKREERQIRVV